MFQVAAVIGYARKYDKEEHFFPWICGISGRDYRNIFAGSISQDLSPGTNGRGFVPIQYMDLKYIDLPNITEGNVDFIGYFQSEKYFENCREEIRQLFRPNQEIKRYIEEKYADLLKVTNKVSLHVRTASRPGVDSPSVHAAASREFIEKAMKEFDEDSVFVVFADILDEAKKILPEGKKYVFIEGEENYVDLFLMNYFDSYIVSPSTFGWWGAWLSKSDSPKITVLKDWFVGYKSYLNDNDIIPSDWIQIEV